jgi:hypothetical protein
MLEDCFFSGPLTPCHYRYSYEEEQSGFYFGHTGL